MNKIEELFTPIIGQMLWSVKRGHGSWFAIEFGKPHIEIKEPHNSKADHPKVIENARKRRVFIEGQWNLLVMNASWNLSAWEKTCKDSDDVLKIDEIMGCIDGQKLSRVICNPKTHSLTLECDLGGIISLQMPEENTSDDLWGITDNDTGSLVCYANDGTITMCKTKPYLPGSIGLMSSSGR